MRGRVWHPDRAVAIVVFLIATLATPAASQFPGELRGSVTTESGRPVAAAQVEMPEVGLSTLTDAAGRFSMRGLEAGRFVVVVQRIGFAPWAGEVEVTNGRVAQLRVALVEAAVELEAVKVVAEERVAGAAVRLAREQIERAGSRTAGDVVRLAPGTVVQEGSTGGAQTVSIRGSGAAAVLVLLDGVPLNDPVTGVADLSTVPAGAIESLTVIAGAQGARYGPRAEAGVVLIETRSAETGVEGRAAAGSLGEWSVAGEASTAIEGIDVSVGGHRRGIGGAFDYPRVEGVDETIERRVNADLVERGAFAALHTGAAGGEVRVRAGAASLDRGLPGKGYAPSPAARQEMDRLRGAVTWRRSARQLATTVSLAAVSQRARFADPSPPFGLPYDDETRVRSYEARGEIGRPGGSGALRGMGSGVEVHRQHVDGGSLSEGAPRLRTDAGAFAHTEAGLRFGSWDFEVSLEGRLDRDGLADRWYPNRAIGVHLTRGPLALQLTNRSGYSPPSLGDQFFREGVAVAPNPDLQAERIPSEWEIGARSTGHFFATDASAGVRLHAGDVRGMIVWLPDFRFVWSPRNSDVKRRGMELWGEIDHAASGLRLAGSYSLAAVTYDREGDADDVQVAYRPRHTSQLTATWQGGPWQAGVAALYTGERNPAPAALNQLEGFWTLDLDAARSWRVPGADLTTAIHVDRILDEKSTLIFGFPEAGRRIRFEARVRRADES
ncbi:MAG: TonB-dependent receptor [Gemmatimonas sp.]|nr:TonB-dependent receptor [Gemmatimonas sp.]